MLSVLLAPALAQAEDAIRLVVGGVEVETDVAPVIEGGRTLVPLRAVTEALGFEVQWDGPSQTAILTRGETTIMLTADRPDALVNGHLITLDVPPTIRSDRMMVPVRFVAEQIGLDVAWDEATRTVVIAPKEPAVPAVSVDPEAIALLEQLWVAGSYRITGDVTMSAVTALETLEAAMTMEAYRSGTDEALAYTTFRTGGLELTTAMAVHEGQAWAQDVTGAWIPNPLEELDPADLFTDPTSLASLTTEALMGASITRSQHVYEGNEMQVVTVLVDLTESAEFAEVIGLFGLPAEQFKAGLYEVSYWFNADNTPHHADLSVELIMTEPELFAISVGGSLYWEPWDQPIPFPPEITGVGE